MVLKCPVIGLVTSNFSLSPVQIQFLLVTVQLNVLIYLHSTLPHAVAAIYEHNNTTPHHNNAQMSDNLFVSWVADLGTVK